MLGESCVTVLARKRLGPCADQLSQRGLARSSADKPVSALVAGGRTSSDRLLLGARQASSRLKFMVSAALLGAGKEAIPMQPREVVLYGFAAAKVGQ